MFFGAIISPSKEFRPVKLPLFSEATNTFDNLYSTWVDSVFYSLTPDQRIGQLFFAPAYSNQGRSHFEEIARLINEHQIGGLIFFQGGPVRQAHLVNRYQSISKTPLLIAMDAEWGLGMRLDSTISFPRQMALGAIQDMTLIHKLGAEIGRQCRELGVHINFAPVVDLNNNPLNPVIGIRSFGEDKRDVAQRALMLMGGMQEQGILTSAKHFPGHGNTTTDSHHELPVVTQTYSELFEQEWFPYIELFKFNITGVMAAHVHVPEIDNTPNLAASLSQKILTDILRDSLNFSGLIFTDALNMKGVTDHFKSGELEVKALEAGVDVLLMPVDIPKAITAINEALDSGRLDRRKLDLSCRKILAAKERAGLNNHKSIEISGLRSRLNNVEAELLNRELVEASLTIVKNRDSILPMKRLDKEKTAILLTGVSMENQFLNTLKLYEENSHFFLFRGMTRQQEIDLFDRLSTYSRVIVGIHNTNLNPASNYGILPNISAFVDRLADVTNVILCLFSPPYALSEFNNSENMAAIVVGYQATSLVQDYTAQLLYGAIHGKGRLSVSVDSVFHIGMGVNTRGGLRLKYSIPEEVDVFSDRLWTIDSMVMNAIREEAFPGCQILAARNGVVFFNKVYGQTRYDEHARPVATQHIYDLASVSKVAATAPAVMKLYDDRLFSLHGRLSNYLPEMEDSDKENIQMIYLLTHQSRLPSHIAFYLRTKEPLDNTERLLAPQHSSLHSIYLGPRTFLNSQRRFKEGIFSKEKTDFFSIKVADSLFVVNTFPDTMLRGIRNVRMLTRRQMVYSDLGFILLGKVVERISEKPLDEYLSQTIYAPLGASTLCFKPLDHFPHRRIVPTSNDTVFRRQWLQGYVHDENAALMGGVSGHAGLFGNANDLAKLMQMFLNMGTYGGERYIRTETVMEFTSSPFLRHGNRRALAFDKPDHAARNQTTLTKNSSPMSYGHTGFTGTMVWTDPDKGLLYIFLSNRVCPDDTNNKLNELGLRARIYEAFVKAIGE